MKVKPLKDALLSVRMPAELKARILNVHAITHVPISTLVMESMEATCDYVESRGEIRIPFRLIPCNEFKLPQDDAKNHLFNKKQLK